MQTGKHTTYLEAFQHLVSEFCYLRGCRIPKPLSCKVTLGEKARPHQRLSWGFSTTPHDGYQGKIISEFDPNRPPPNQPSVN